MGVPMAASDIRGCREVIVHGQTGLLVGLKDVDGLSAAVEGLLRNRDERRRLGEAGRQHVLAHYTEGLVAGRLAACYEEFLAARGEQTKEVRPGPNQL